MVNGLQFDVQSDELKKIVQTRVEYHTEKADVYTTKAASLKEALNGVDEETRGKVSNGSPVGQLEDKAREHRNKAIHFQFMLDHVIQNDVYRLSQNDLHMLGISPERHF
jgi:hypothetical protein